MTVKNLRDLLTSINCDNAEVLLNHDGDNFYDGRKVTGVMVMHHYPIDKKDEKDTCLVFIEEE